MPVYPVWAAIATFWIGKALWWLWLSRRAPAPDPDKE